MYNATDSAALQWARAMSLVKSGLCLEADYGHQVIRCGAVIRFHFGPGCDGFRAIVLRSQRQPENSIAA